MPLAPEKKQKRKEDFSSLRTNEQIGKAGQSVERKLDEVTKEAEKTTGQGPQEKITPAEVLEDRKAGVQKEPKILKEQLEGMSVDELGQELANEMAQSNKIEEDGEINKIMKAIVDKLSNSDVEEGDAILKITDIASTANEQVEGIFSWLQQELANRVFDARKNHPIM